MKMTPPKLWLLYKTLSAKEQKEAQKWMYSSFGKATPQMKELWEKLEKGINPKEVVEEMFSDLKDPYGGFRKVVSNMAEELENFLVYHKTFEDEVRRNLILLDIYNEHLSSTKHAKMQYNKTLKAIEEGISSKDDIYHEAWGQLQATYQQIQQKSLAKGVQETEASIIKHLDKRYLFERFLIDIGLSITLRTSSKPSHKTKPDSTLNQSLLDISAKYPEDLGIQFLRDVYLYFHNESEIELSSLTRRFRDDLYSFFSEENQKAIFSIIHSYFMMNIRHQSFHPQLPPAFDWYKWGVDQGYLLYNGFLPATHYKLFFSLAFRLGKYEEMKPYVKTLEKHLHEDEKKDMEKFLTLRENFHAKNKKNNTSWEKVIGLSKWGYVRLNTELDARFLALLARLMLRRLHDFKKEILAVQKRLKSPKKGLSDAYQRAYQNRLAPLEQLLTIDLNDEASRKAFVAFLDARVEGPDDAWLRKWINSLPYPFLNA